MEQNVQVMAKKLWHIVRVAFFMVRKNMSKRKLLLDLKYFAMKRPKIADKSLVGKVTPHHDFGGAYEFSCSNTPNHSNYFHFQFKHKKRSHKSKNNAHAPIYEDVEESELHAVNKVLEMMLTSGNCQNNDVDGSPFPYFYSPALSGFGPSPVVRVTDSPYPLHEGDVGNSKVDEAAEEFIQRFYDQLRKQRIRDSA